MKGSRGKSAAPSASGNIGASRFPDSAIPQPVFIFWGWRPRRMARIAPAECLREIVREIFFTARYTAPVLPISHIRSSVEMGSELSGAYIGATLRCAPPANKPLPSELQNCRPYLEAELSLLRPRAILALGGIAMRAYLALLMERGVVRTFAAYPFRHGAVYKFAGELPRLFLSYHPSQQNTFTGKLTPAMMSAVLRRIRKFLG